MIDIVTTLIVIIAAVIVNGLWGLWVARHLD